MILYVRHVAIEGSGTLGSFLAREGCPSRTVALDAGEPVPSSLEGIDLVVILGGPMNVYQEREYPFLRDELVFIERAMKAEVPTIGLCLGAQLIARAAGAKVYRAPEPEIGFYSLAVTPEGRRDPVIAGIPNPVELFEWHEDTFDLPRGAVLLLRGASCAHQAFRLGRAVYGFQCHMETTRAMARQWVDEYLVHDRARQMSLRDRLEGEFSEREEHLRLVNQRLYGNLLTMMGVGTGRSH